jgi:hypothetical protein
MGLQNAAEFNAIRKVREGQARRDAEAGKRPSEKDIMRAKKKADPGFG